MDAQKRILGGGASGLPLSLLTHIDHLILQKAGLRPRS